MPTWNPEAVPVMRVTEFWMLVDRQGEDDCWPWRGSYNDDGYGVYFVDGVKVNAHEVALTFKTGERRHPELDTCHSCSTPPCCNPGHLRFDTRQSNVDDMVALGRHRHLRIPDTIVRLIRERREAGASQEDLARQYGLSDAYVSTIVNGKVRMEAGGPIATRRRYYKRRNYEEKSA